MSSLTRLKDHKYAWFFLAYIGNFLLKKLVITPLLPCWTFKPSSHARPKPMVTRSCRLRITCTLSRSLEATRGRVERMCRQVLIRLCTCIFVSVSAGCRCVTQNKFSVAPPIVGVRLLCIQPPPLPCERSDSSPDEQWVGKAGVEDGLSPLELEPDLRQLKLQIRESRAADLHREIQVS